MDIRIVGFGLGLVVGLTLLIGSSNLPRRRRPMLAVKEWSYFGGQVVVMGIVLTVGSIVGIAVALL